MREIETPADMDALVGETLGESAWLEITQTMINQFAEATGDHQWIHTDLARAAAELPGGKTIAHGYLTLSLLPRLAQDIYRIRRRARMVNQGSNRVRFLTPVPAGGRVRLKQVLQASEPIEGGRRLTIAATLSLEGAERPAVIAETIALAFDDQPRQATAPT